MYTQSDKYAMIFFVIVVHFTHNCFSGNLPPCQLPPNVFFSMFYCFSFDRNSRASCRRDESTVSIAITPPKYPVSVSIGVPCCCCCSTVCARLATEDEVAALLLQMDLLLLLLRLLLLLSLRLLPPPRSPRGRNNNKELISFFTSTMRPCKSLGVSLFM